MPMILEGIVTTVNADGRPHAAPMGPETDEQVSYLVLKPYEDSTTLSNLRRNGRGVFHVTDDVELLAQAAVGQLQLHVRGHATSATDAPTNKLPGCYAQPAPEQAGYFLENCCRWFAFHVVAIDATQPRARLQCVIDARGSEREFFGFNRAKHAVVEAAILATRVHLIPCEEMRREFDRLRVIVAKTGGDCERRAFEFLERHIRQVSMNIPWEAATKPPAGQRHDPALPAAAPRAE
jgi:hypothetical protein